MRGPILFLPAPRLLANGQSQRPACTLNETPPHSATNGQIQIPNRSSDSLFIGQQGKQRTEIHFDPATGVVTLKLLVQDVNGYFIPICGATTSSSTRITVRQTNATVEIEHAPVSLALALEFGGRYPSLNKIIADQVFEGGRQLIEAVRPGRPDRDLEIRGTSGTINRLFTRPRNAQESAQFRSAPQCFGSEFV